MTEKKGDNNAIGLTALGDIQERIFTIRGSQVMLDSDLANLYMVETKVLNQAVKRNIRRFPEEFCFQLADDEFQILKSQIVTSSWGGRRTRPYAFTEQGVAMLSAILKSDVAIDISVRIIRAFVEVAVSAGLAPCAFIGHSQGSGYAVRGKEHVLVSIIGKFPVHLKGEFIATLD